MAARALEALLADQNKGKRMLGILAALFYIGCYTDEAHPEGLRIVDVDSANGSIKLVESYKVNNPLYLAKSLDGRYLFCNESSGLGSFTIGKNGKLSRRDYIDLGGRAMCHLAIMPNGTSITWAAYTSGEAGLVEIADGKFIGEIRHDKQVGSGPHPAQKSAHCHMAEPTPDGEHYAVVDLGCDTVTVYPAKEKDQGTVHATEPRGAGPRHIIFHPDGKLAFIITEHGRRLLVYEWNGAGLGKKLDEARSVPSDFVGLNQDSAIRFSPDGKRVIVSNRGFDALTSFAFDQSTGKLGAAMFSPLPGSWPRDFVFIENSDLAIVTMERSGTLLTVRYDKETGRFTAVDTLHNFHRPVAVVAAAMEN